jgi:opacity protein-like surface antigen
MESTMKKFLLIAVGAASLLAADIAAAQTQPAPPAPPAAPGGGPGFGRGGPGFDRWGPGFDRGGRHGFRGGRGRFDRHRPTLEEAEKRNAERFAQMDANHDGRVTFEEFRGYIERQRTERQRQMFQRFTGGADSVTLDQLNARAAERMKDRGGRGPGGPAGTPPALGRAPAR